MRVQEANEIYQLFEDFLSTSILGDDSFMTDEKGVFTIEALEEVIDRFIKNPIKGKGSFDDKITKQLGSDKVSDSARLVMAHAIWLWCMAPNDFRLSSKKELSTNIIQEKRNFVKASVYPSRGFGNAGPRLKYNKPDEIAFCLLLFQMLKENVKSGKIKSVEEAKTWTERYCIKTQYDEDTEGYNWEPYLEWVSGNSLAMYNILLHLSNPDNYERISSNLHKNRIYNAFQGLLDDAPQNILDSNRDEQLLYMREKISVVQKRADLDFYEWDLQRIWNYAGGSMSDSFDEIQALLYKKAVIFYGPPGTSKTYTAKQLAEALVYQHYFKSKENIKNYLLGKLKPEEVASKIHRLQLHPNYSYEDFIAGIQIRANQTEPVKGYFLELIEKVKDDPHPHVLILDEINRIDLSRLFGELFSALENRGETIELPIGNFKIKVPENLYVIGTMNEIDFSLERLDFALRRRFVWYFYGYNEDKLRTIIEEKNAKKRIRLKEKDIDTFIGRVTKLNKAIQDNEDLGASYEIGHTFFGELPDIHETYVLNTNRKRSFKLYKKDGPIEILWTISIEPILNAFLGNLDNETKLETIKKFKSIYLNGK